MEFIEEDLLHEPTYFNPEYEDKRTAVAHKVEISYKIEKRLYYNYTLLISTDIRFSDKINQDVVAHLSTSKVLEASPSIGIKGYKGMNPVYNILSIMILEIRRILDKEIPPQRIDILPPLVGDYEIKKVADDAFSELKILFSEK